MRGLAGNIMDWAGSTWSEKWSDIALDNGTIHPKSFKPNFRLTQVNRGGSWYFSAKDIPIASRHVNDQTHRSACLGFRIGRSAFR